MRPVLLIMNSTPPTRHFPDWQVVWCPPTPQEPPPSTVDMVLVLPAACPPLSALLLAGSLWPPLLQVAVTTVAAPPHLPDPHSPVPGAWLTSRDEGTLFFPYMEMAATCIREAIRQHNPETGSLTLTDGWHQVCLARLKSGEEA